jgi:arylsulfatase A-like enzyme
MNVLHIITHDTGRMVGPYHPQIRVTPNLDAFARDAVRFDNAFCAAPCCGPSRVCAMTGKISHRTGTLGLGHMGWLLPDAERTLVDDFNDAGYQTVHAGFCHERLYGGMRYAFDGEAGVDESWWKCDSRLAVDRVIAWLDSGRGRGRPFYINLATNETHASHFQGRLTQSRHGGPVDDADVWVPPAWPDVPAARQSFNHWYSSLRYFDFHFGRLMAALDRLGLRDNTLVVYTTDHGIGGIRGKSQVTELGVETALLLRLPGNAYAGAVHDPLLPNIDIRPTLLDACGIPVPSGLDGRSFWPLVQGGPYTAREEAFVERNFHGERDDAAPNGHCDFYDPQRAVRTRDWHYIRHVQAAKKPQAPYAWQIRDFANVEQVELMSPVPPAVRPRPAEELYYLRGDPWEMNNLAGDPAVDSIRADLAARLDRWMAETNDPALRPGIPAPLQDPAIWPTAGRFHQVKRC